MAYTVWFAAIASCFGALEGVALQHSCDTPESQTLFNLCVQESGVTIEHFPSLEDPFKQIRDFCVQFHTVKNKCGVQKCEDAAHTNVTDVEKTCAEMGAGRFHEVVKCDTNKSDTNNTWQQYHRCLGPRLKTEWASRIPARTDHEEFLLMCARLRIAQEACGTEAECQPCDKDKVDGDSGQWACELRKQCTYRKACGFTEMGLGWCQVSAPNGCHGEMAIGRAHECYSKTSMGLEPPVESEIDSASIRQFCHVTLMERTVCGDEQCYADCSGFDPDATNIIWNTSKAQKTGEDKDAVQSTGEDKDADQATAEDQDPAQATGEDQDADQTTAEDQDAGQTTGENKDADQPTALPDPTYQTTVHQDPTDQTTVQFKTTAEQTTADPLVDKRWALCRAEQWCKCKGDPRFAKSPTVCPKAEEPTAKAPVVNKDKNDESGSAAEGISVGYMLVVFSVAASGHASAR